MGKIKDKFYYDLERHLNYGIKHSNLDEEEARTILDDWPVEKQVAWLSYCDFKAEMAKEVQDEG